MVGTRRTLMVEKISRSRNNNIKKYKKLDDTNPEVHLPTVQQLSAHKHPPFALSPVQLNINQTIN